MTGGAVLVMGGGIGGLTAATALAQRGFAVTVIERSDGSGVEGVGISQQANVVRAMAGLGLADEYLDAGFAYDAVEIYAPDGRMVARTQARSLIEGFPASMGIPRPALQRVLADAACKAGASLRYSTTAEMIEDEGEAVGVRFSDGTSARFDLVVGADGIYSQLRRQLFPGTPEPAFTGQGVWRYNLPRPEGFAAMQVYNGPMGVGLVPMSREEIYLYATTPEQDDPSYHREGLAAVLRGKLAASAPQIRALAEEVVRDASVVYRPLETIFLEGPWHRGRIVLLGDAIHATTPHLGQGGGMAIEDAVVLAEELARQEDHEQAFAAYRARRFERCRFVADTSLKICMGQLGKGPLIDNAAAGAEMGALLAEPI